MEENKNIDIEYIVAPGRSIITRAGVIGPQEKITRKECQNFDTLLSKKWILEKEKLSFKNENEKNSAMLAKKDDVVIAKDEKQEIKEQSKNEIMKELGELGIEYNPREKKAVLSERLKQNKSGFIGGAKKKELSE